ncbi:unnamed protein product [Ostreobium quekettii]|uniref:Uncharacterized protein n=1 Tax=Ostreobium quekettii TaxID=121088 RepID=A0A8S1IRU8_9CHLO|nr:unnamed protein product [Ostreobium quekettii]|eukprot:evm.model.scf_799.7 EVM.evm.TU.scf_799.7   scf_799:59458-60192(-)
MGGAKWAPEDAGSAAIGLWRLLALILATGAAGMDQAGVRAVEDCGALRAALESNATARVNVSGALVCDAAAWGPAVVIRRNLTIAGAAKGGVAPSVDWASGVGLIEAASGSNVLFRDMILMFQGFGAVAVDIPFYFHQEAGETVLAGVVVAARVCPLAIDNYQDILTRLVRPENVPGEQLATVLDNSTLIVEELFVQRSEALWRICRSGLYCGDDAEVMAALLRGNATGSPCAEAAASKGSGGR